jgi:hypothetical protein
VSDAVEHTAARKQVSGFVGVLGVFDRVVTRQTPMVGGITP